MLLPPLFPIPPFSISFVHWESSGCLLCPIHRLFVFIYLSAFLSIHLSGLLQHSSQDGANVVLSWMAITCYRGLTNLSYHHVYPSHWVVKFVNCVFAFNMYFYTYCIRINFTRLKNCLLSDHFFVFLDPAFFCLNIVFLSFCLSFIPSLSLSVFLSFCFRDMVF